MLGELPAFSYEMKHLTFGKVQRNYHLILGEDYHQYSVPFTLIGKKLKIIYTSDTVEIYDEFKRVAVHKRSYKKHGYTTLEEHMPPNHRYIARGWNADYFEQQAAAVGAATLSVVKKILTSKFFHEQTYNSCLGILRLGKKYSNERLEAACSRALASPIINYKTIENILKKNLDKQPLLLQENVFIIPKHEQLRGSAAYQ